MKANQNSNLDFKNYAKSWHECLMLIIFSILFFSCQKEQVQQKPIVTDTTKTVSGIYKFNSGKRDIFNIWIVDGAAIRREIFSEFLFGGNSERYQFIPEDEI